MSANGMVQLASEKCRGTTCLGGMGIDNGMIFVWSRHALVGIGIDMGMRNACFVGIGIVKCVCNA